MNEALASRWDALMARLDKAGWGKETVRPTYAWTRAWMFEAARALHGGFEVGCVHSVPGDHWLLCVLYGPRFQHFRKDHHRPGQLWSPRRWGGAVLGLEIGQR